MKIRIATRKSQLALWQAEFVKSELLKLDSKLDVELVPMTSRGDKILDMPLAKIGGKGLFLKELELAMQENEADIAVHSMKDVTMEFPEGLQLTSICEREDPRDAFISNAAKSLAELAPGSTVGTSSLRRKTQLQNKRPDLIFKDLRGNVNSRLQKMDSGDYDAIILAAAGMKRLKMDDRIKESLSPETSLPAVGQGAVGIESRIGDDELNQLLRKLTHQPTWDCVMAERAMNTRLNGGCQVPIAGHATIEGANIHLKGLVASVDGKTILSASRVGPIKDGQRMGLELAEDLLSQGAGEILAAIELP